MKVKVEIEVDDVIDRGPAFYKYTSGTTILQRCENIYEPNGNHINIQNHNAHSFPKLGWKYFKTEAAAKQFYGIEDKLEYTIEEFLARYGN